MKIFVPKEIKTHEYRVSLVPHGTRELVDSGHEVFVETGAGAAASFADDDYVAAGARILDSPQEGYETAELVMKVKEPIGQEIDWLRPGLSVFGYFHLAADRDLTMAILQSGATAIAYETLLDEHGQLPLLTPMSAVAGRISIQLGARLLEKPQGGRGVLLGGVPGVLPGHVTIIGAGVVGTEAAKMAAGLGARVHVLDTNAARLRQLSEVLPAHVVGLTSSRGRILEELRVADLVIGAVLIVGARTPRLIEREDLRLMKRGAVVVDVAIDQGGCTEVSRPTTHAAPSYVEEGVVFSCVTNLPGAVSLTSTQALCDATFPYVRLIADHGLDGACRIRTELSSAINIREGKVKHAAVAEAFSLSLN
jgi:alanine dehydrogenase